MVFLRGAASSPPATVRLLLFSRLLVIAIACVANHLLPDHDAGVFAPPPVAPATDARRPLDAAVEWTLGGLRRWDAHYHLHNAEHGNTYEQTLAFYPLLPLLVRTVATALHTALALHYVLSFRELLLVSAVLVNVVAFVRAGQTLGRLTDAVFGSARLTQNTVLLFAFNPAAVFFTAPYTESLFAWATFATMEQCQRKRYFAALVPLCASIACRSNGAVNCGFVVFHVANDVLAVWTTSTTQTKRHRRTLGTIVPHASRLLTCLTAAAFTFGAVQWHQYQQFCVDDGGALVAAMPAAIRRYGEQKAFVLAGQFGRFNSSWCHRSVPMAYGYVQQHYWNCGPFAYYEWRQLPNFALAAPVLGLVAHAVWAYTRRQWRAARRADCVPRHLFDLVRWQRTVDQRLLVYVVHAAALALVCVVYAHIQVSTRLLASATPVVCWSAAAALRWDGGGVLRWREFVRRNRALSAWFGGYLVVGTVLFANHLPWT